MNLSGDGDVFPLHQGGLASGHIHGFHLGIGDVALVLQLPQVVPARNRQVLDVNIPGIVGGVLPDGGVGAVVEQEGHALDALAGDAVGLMNQYPAERLVGDGDRGGFAILDGEVGGGGVQLEALRRLDLHCVVVAGVQIQMGAALLVRGHGIHQTAIHAADLEGGVGDALALVGLVDLDQLQTAHRGVVKFQGLRVPDLDLDGLGGGVQQVAIQGADLLGDDGHAGFQALDHDPAILIGGVLAVGAAQHLPVGFGDQEGHALQGGGGAGDVLLNDQPGLGVILESEIVAAVGSAAHIGGAARIGRAAVGPAHGAAVHRVGAVFHDDGLGRAVEDIATRHLGLCDHHGAAGNKAGDRHSAV